MAVVRHDGRVAHLPDTALLRAQHIITATVIDRNIVAQHIITATACTGNLPLCLST